MEEIDLKQLLIRYCEENGYGSCEGDSNEELYEGFENVTTVVWEGEPDRHRWYTIYDVVRKLTVEGVDYFFEDQYWEAHGDNSAEDCGWKCPDISTIVQVFPKQVTTTIYVSKDKL